MISEVKSIIASLLVVAFVALAVSGQNTAAVAGDATKKDQCGLKEIAFPCPANLKINQQASSENIFIMSSERYKYNVFLISSKTAINAQTADKLVKELLPKIYPDEPQTYQWKNSPSFDEKPLSKYELSYVGIAGFNNSHQIGIKYRRIKFGKQEFLLGYAYEGNRGGGKDRERLFKASLGGDSAPACQDLVEILFSITKEPKRKGIEFACSPA